MWHRIADLSLALAIVVVDCSGVCERVHACALPAVFIECCCTCYML
jgi:hypothetical protein